jgi:hypothetical protein
VQTINSIVQNPIRCPESDKGDSRLHQNAFENVTMNVVPEFVGQNRFNLVGGIVCQQGVRQYDPAGVAKSG